MQRSINNSFDSTDMTFISASGFTGTYEPNLNYNYIRININTQNNDTLQIEQIDNPLNIVNPIIDTYSINNIATQIMAQLKLRFFRIIISSGTDSKRVYETYLIDNISKIQNIDSSGNIIVNGLTSGKLTLWNNISITNDNVSDIFNLSVATPSNLTFYGTLDKIGSLTVQFSNDGITFFNTQYIYTFVSIGDFGFNLTCCPQYVRLKVSIDPAETGNITAILNYC